MFDSAAGSRVAQRADVAPFQVMEVVSAATARQREHGDVVSLAAGQPAASAPTPVREAAAAALTSQQLGYTEQFGIPELRAAVAGHYRDWYGVDVNAEDVVLTTGASGAFLLAFLAAFDAGDRVALAQPGYPAYRNILSALGCEVVELPCTAETRFQPTVRMLEELDEPVQGLIVASPANPTGTVLGDRELADLSTWCSARGVRLISDEIYHGVEYGDGGTARSASCAWQHGRDSVVIGSFSKYFAMTGWRLGWMLAPPDLHRAVGTLAGNFTICPPALSQHAAVAAFDPRSYAEADGHVSRYRTNRDLLLDGLDAMGITGVAPANGAFYVYADVGHLTTDTLEFSKRLLDDTGVAVVPGTDFDPARGQQFLRLSFAGSTEDVRTAVQRMGGWLVG